MHADLDNRWSGVLWGAVSTDTRTTRSGDFFLALTGPNFDGHKFCERALERGAAGLIVSQTFDDSTLRGDVPILRVDDTLRAYGDLASACRRRWDGPVLAISGSGGKTTTRRLAAAALAKHLRVLEPPGNFNNLVGVPRTLLELEPDHQIAVMELGMNQPGELQRLTRICEPSAVLLTNIGISHVGMFRSMDDLVQAKLDLLRHAPDGVPWIVNAACARTMLGVERLKHTGPLIQFLGPIAPVWDNEVQVRIENVQPRAPVGYRFDLVAGETRIEGLEIGLFGRHHLDNVAAAAALLLAAERPVEWIAEALPDFKGESLRGQLVQTDRWTFILDCYNASPAAMLGALRSLADMAEGKRLVLVLADMLELGAQTIQAHEMLVDPIRQLAPALFFGLGPECVELVELLVPAGIDAKGFEDRDALTKALRERLEPGDLVFFKGSHGFGLETVADALAPEANILGA